MQHEFTAGVVADCINVVANAVSDSLGKYDEHYSLYLGPYHMFQCPEKVKIEFNFVEEEGEWNEPEYKNYGILFTIGDTERPSYFERVLRKSGLGFRVLKFKEWSQ